MRRSQLRALGIPKRTFEDKVARHEWTAVGYDVLRRRGTPDTLLVRTRAVALAHPEEPLTGASTAALFVQGPWGDLDLGRTPWLLTERRDRIGELHIRHPPARVFRHRGLLTVTLRDAVVDLMRFLPLSQARRVAYSGVQSSDVKLDWLVERTRQLTRFAGAPQLRLLLRDLLSGAHSENERFVHAALERAGISGWVANYPVLLGKRRFVLDLAFPDLLLAVEADGRSYHSSEEQFQKDRERQNLLVNAGWRVLRYTWQDATEHSDRIVAEVRQAIADLSRGLPRATA